MVQDVRLEHILLSDQAEAGAEDDVPHGDDWEAKQDAPRRVSFCSGVKVRTDRAGWLQTSCSRQRDGVLPIVQHQAPDKSAPALDDVGRVGSERDGIADDLTLLKVEPRLTLALACCSDGRLWWREQRGCILVGQFRMPLGWCRVGRFAIGERL
jgi:hypothetical protein